MRHLALILCLIGLSQSAWAERYCPENIRNSYECYLHRERQLSREYGRHFYRKGRTVYVRLANGRITSFRDVPEDDIQSVDTVKLYALVKYFPAVGYWLVAVQFYEGSTYLLLNAKDGTATTVEGEALLSPDKRRFVVFSFDIEAGYSPNVLSIYRLAGARLIQEFVDKPTDWGATEVAWKNSTTVTFLKTSLADNGYATVAQALLGTPASTGRGKKWEIQ